MPLGSNRSTSLIQRGVELGARGPPVVRVVGPIVRALPASGTIWPTTMTKSGQYRTKKTYFRAQNPSMASVTGKLTTKARS